MHLQQMLRQDRVTLKKDTLPLTHRDTDGHACVCVSVCARTFTQARQRKPMSGQERQRGGVLFSRSLLCLSAQRDDGEGRAMGEKEGQGVRE